ncbi:uncharacterized protein si:ch73-248e21.5 isoform X2 [Esox lucius]|nr:uncharacterized protein si:ch73-248e21.5 isoform X2 [Esox lucius]
MMKVSLISLALCLPHLLDTAVLHSTTEASLSPTKKPRTFLDLRLSHTTPETLKPSVSTTETQPGWTKGMFNSQKETTAGLAQVKDSGGTTKGDLVRRGISLYAVTAVKNLNGHAPAGGSRWEKEIHSSHGALLNGEHTSLPSANQHSTLPGEERATYHDSSTTDTARELITPNSTGTWAADSVNYTRLATTLFDESPKDQQTATPKGLESARSATPAGNYYREKSDFFMSTSSSRTTGSNKSKQSGYSSAIPTVSPNYTVTLPGTYEHMTVTTKAVNLKTQREDTNQSVVNRVTSMASILHANISKTLHRGTNNALDYNIDEYAKELWNSSSSRTSKDHNQTVLLYDETSLSGQGNGLNNITAFDHTAHPECREEDEMQASVLHGPSRLVCFVILWALAMTASVSLGLSIFLWVRMSVQKDKKRVGDGRRERASKVNLESLWTDQTTSVEERVEFWYANGTTLGHNQQGRERKREWREEKGNGGKGKEKWRGSECESLWIQPKVTLEDITDFWYANGRMRPEEPTDQRLLETCV